MHRFADRTARPVPIHPATRCQPPARSPAPWRWLDRGFGAALVGALAMAALSAWPGAAQAQRHTGDGQASTEERALEAFTGVQTTQLTVVVRQGGQHQAVVVADRNLLALLETEVQDGPTGRTLIVRWKPGVGILPMTPPRITVQAPQPQRLTVVGSGDLIAEGLNLPRLQASVRGAGDLRLDDLKTDALNLEVTGSGDLRASGQAGQLQLRIAGSGDVDAARLRADEVSVAIAGSGNASVDAQRTLSISIAGSGNVQHSGPAQPQTKVSGSGNVRRR